MEFDYIIVQAGGKGTRMQYLTANKPKALVPIGNRPMLFHLFEKFHDKRFIIIADYKSDVLEKYLAVFADVRYLVVETHGKTGTCSGISSALKYLPSGEPFMLIWSDLVLSNDLALPEGSDNYVALAENFRCRWQYRDGSFQESPSEQFGVAGMFLFQDKEFLSNVPEEGEFVKWLKDSGKHFSTFGLKRSREYGLIQEWQKDNAATEDISGRCRPFNQLTVDNNIIVKQGIDQQGLALAEREINWYKYVSKFNYKRIPEIYSLHPLTMSRIHGKNVFEYDMTTEQKRVVLQEIVSALRELHSFGETSPDYFSINEAYVTKTFKRLEKIRDMVPFSDRKYITVNGKKCPNVFYFKEELKRKFARYTCEKFTFIHGDCTFSNILLNENQRPVFIDPRGYFGFTELFGDANYDWAKLYYSVAGNYDKFNLKKFRLEVLEEEVNLEIESNGWEELAPYLCTLLSDEVDEQTLKLLHAVIWLSLTTYAWEDYDSILGAFYNGLYYLEEVL